MNKKISARLIYIFACVCICSVLSGQNASKNKITENEIDTILKKSKEVMYTSPDITLAKAWQALGYSRSINYNIGIAGAYKIIGSYYSDLTAKYDSALFYIDSSMFYYKSAGGVKGKEGEGAIWHNRATIKYRKGEYLDALDLYLKAARILDSIGNTSVIMLTYNNLSTLYTFYKQPEKALEYSKLCLEAAEKNKNQHMISVASITYGSALIQLGKYTEALPFIERAGEIAQKRNDHYITELYYVNLSAYYMEGELNYHRAIELSKKARIEAGLLQNSWELLRIATSLADLYCLNKEFVNAEKELNIALSLNKEIGSQDIQQRLLKIQGKVFMSTGKYKKASEALLESLSLQDTVFNQANQLQTNYYEALYQKEKQELKINRLENEKQISAIQLRKRRFLNLLQFSILLVIVLVSVLIYKSLRNKKILAEKNYELQKEQFDKLEKEQQLMATKAVLSGEESERRRLARDLHDGLGGMLSGIKLKLSGIKGSFIIGSESARNFDMAIESLDASVKEMRRVAHNLMPEVLVKYGLNEAVGDFCSSLDNSVTEISYRFYGEPKRIDQNIEVATYRIMQELVNNALKHAGAEKILIQIVQDENRLSLTVQDNGKGFKLEELKEFKGVGIESIKARVKALNGIIDIYSTLGKGTEIEVEFHINS